MKTKTIIISSIIATILLISYFSLLNTNSTTYQEKILKSVSLSEWKNTYENNKNLIIIDVRTPEEYNKGHIENAINIDYYNPNFQTELKKLDKTKEYLIHCKSGSRSGKTLNIMKNLNFKNVLNLKGGINGWITAKYKTTTKCPHCL